MKLRDYANTSLTLILAAAAVPLAGAQSTEATIEEQVVLGVRARLEQAGALKPVIEKTELIGNAQLESTQAISLSDALGDAPAPT